MTTTTSPRHMARAEEWANSASHALGFVLAAAALPVLWQLSRSRGGPVLHSAGVCVFAGSMMVLFAASAICHALPHGPAKGWFDRADRAAIYVFIAGSYSPFALASLKGGSEAAAWLLAAVWAAAVAGTVRSMRARALPPFWSMACYLGMGWLVLLAALPVIGPLQQAGAAWLLAGGLAYSAGAGLFLLSERLPYAHLGWHLLVMLGSALHGVAVWQVV